MSEILRCDLPENRQGRRSLSAAGFARLKSDIKEQKEQFHEKSACHKRVRLDPGDGLGECSISLCADGPTAAAWREPDKRASNAFTRASNQSSAESVAVYCACNPAEPVVGQSSTAFPGG